MKVPVTIHGRSKYYAKNHPAMPSVAAKPAAFVFLMIFRTAYTLISENNHPLTCKHDEFDYFLKPAVNSNKFLSNYLSMLSQIWERHSKLRNAGYKNEAEKLLF